MMDSWVSLRDTLRDAEEVQKLTGPEVAYLKAELERSRRREEDARIETTVNTEQFGEERAALHEERAALYVEQANLNATLEEYRAKSVKENEVYHQMRQEITSLEDNIAATQKIARTRAKIAAAVVVGAAFMIRRNSKDPTPYTALAVTALTQLPNFMHWFRR